jgi:hypothetical protein
LAFAGPKLIQSNTTEAAQWTIGNRASSQRSGRTNQPARGQQIGQKKTAIPSRMLPGLGDEPHGLAARAGRHRNET